ncbi:Furin [Geodia barretti]|uniref:Furin n=1 Tax=Geodia barretti TaxID=519541 RepID=A0AA35WT03_GEOBA|nr:Furin [Geodia barretti]
MMSISLALVFVVHVIIVVESSKTKGNVVQDSETYTKSWVVEIDGGAEMANKIAAENGFNYMGELHIGSGRKFYHFQLTESEEKAMKTDSPFSAKTQHLLSEPRVGYVEQQILRPRVRKSYSVPTDPLFSTQWNVLNTGQFDGQFIGNDLNVEPAWIQGYSGCNVTVAVVDDGNNIEKLLVICTHCDNIVTLL